MREEIHTTAQERPMLHISVRNLVEFILRSGDIDDRVGGKDPMKSMQEGSRIHRKIQKKMGADYHAEVPLETRISFDSYDLLVEGRADGVFMKTVELKDLDPAKGNRERMDEAGLASEDGLPLDTMEIPYGIDEIKGVYLDVNEMEEAIPVHLAQAKCYAYMIGLENRLNSVLVQMTYCNLDTEEIRRFREEIAFEELAEWFHDLVHSYKKWADFEMEWRETSLASIETLEFPYDFREGQRELASDVYRTIVQNKLLFVQAPTGSGKTLATVYPSIKAVGQGLARRIFYLTSKTVTKRVALDTYRLLMEKGYRGKTVDITSKDRACMLEERKCNPDDCPYARGHFDRVNDAVYDILTRQDLFDRDSILSWAEERQVCPFELGLDISSWCDNIVCDYNYVFDPSAYLRRFFAEGQRSEGIFLIDEAHNLVDRGRSMYSAMLRKEDFLRMKKILKPFGKSLSNALDKANKTMLVWKNEIEGPILVLQEMDEFIYRLMNVATEMEKFLEKRIPIKEREEVLTFYFDLRFFLDMSDEVDERYVRYCDFNREKEFVVHLFCMDPSRLLQERLDHANAAVMFSATFLPLRYYKNLLCTDEKPYAVYAKSVFKAEQRCVLIGEDVTTRYTQRGSDMYRRFADYLGSMVKAKKGNYMAFFPSYKFLEDVYAEFLERYGRDAISLIQRSSMKEAKRDEFLEEFEKEHDRSLIGFCVMGGLFAEGIDLTADRLIGAAIIGPGLPQVNPEQNLLKEHFDADEETHGQGFQYAYTYPGMAKVLQAAGRVIRTIDDHGVILLLDERFRWSEYLRILPSDWGEIPSVTTDNVEEHLHNFWNTIK